MIGKKEKAALNQSNRADSQKTLEKFDRESRVRKIKHKPIGIAIAILAILYSLFHVYVTFNPLPALLQRSIHLSFGMALIFLIYPTFKKQNREQIPYYDWLLFLLSIGSSLYLYVEYNALVTTRGGIPNLLDILFAILTVILVLEAARRVTGLILPLLALVFLSYPFFSHMLWLPDMLMTRPFDLGDIFGQLYLKTEGLFSTAIGASVQFIFLFILFGAFLARSGMGQLFNDLAMALAGSRQGGPAKVAVISSGFMGSINGAAVANVVGTGAFTIPLMKRIGYSKNFAGAVEASASIGGQILPPIMGASAFIMAETTGIAYGTIALAALIPAVLYFLAVIMQIHFRAGCKNLKGVPKADLPRVKEVLKQRGHLLLPIIGLIFFLYMGVPVGFAALYTIGLTIVVASMRKTSRMGIKDILRALEDGARQSLGVMIACGVVGIIIGVVNLTSFGTVMTSAITSLGAGSLFLTLFLTMIASILLGMGLPSIPAYIITATMTAPALAEFGIPVLAAHLFVFYFGIFANITPPVALAAFAGAGISGGNPMRTGFHALRLSFAGFLIPYLFVYNPSMLFIDPAGLPVNATEFPLPPILEIIFITATAIIGIIGFSASLEGFYKVELKWLVRAVLGIGSLMLIIPEFVTDIIGILIVLCIFTRQAIQFKKQEKGTNAQPAS